jgi:hypothetical protein
MKFFKSTLRIWITITSVAGFFAGWSILAHSPKPQPYVNPDKAALDLPPVPTLASLLGVEQGQSARTFLPSRQFSPRFRTGGS